MHLGQQRRVAHGLRILTYSFVPGAIPETEPNTRLTVYPNPAEGQVRLTLNRDAVVKVSTLTGQTVMTMEGRIGANTLDISSLSSGIYFVSAGNDTQKLVVK